MTGPESNDVPRDGDRPDPDDDSTKKGKERSSIPPPPTFGSSTPPPPEIPAILDSPPTTLDEKDPTEEVSDDPIDGSDPEDGVQEEKAEDKEEDLKPSPFKRFSKSFKNLFKKQDNEIYVYKRAKPQQEIDESQFEGLELIDELDRGSKYVKVNIYLEKDTTENINQPI